MSILQLFPKTLQVCRILVQWNADFRSFLWVLSYEREPIEYSSVETAARKGN
jgi:hypothetical protein